MATQNIVKAALISITMFAATTPVFAAPALDLIPTSRVVRYSDLDLASDRGKQRLETRIKAAVRLVCSDLSNSNATKIEREHNKACKAKALASARRDAETAIAQYENGTRIAAKRMTMVGN
jgi:UrcA family protein